MNAEIITLYRGEDKAIVEKGSQGEAEMRAVGFSEPEVLVPVIPLPVEKPPAKPAPKAVVEEKPEPAKNAKKGHK